MLRLTESSEAILQGPRVVKEHVLAEVALSARTKSNIIIWYEHILLLGQLAARRFKVGLISQIHAHFFLFFSSFFSFFPVVFFFISVARETW